MKFLLPRAKVTATILACALIASACGGSGTSGALGQEANLTPVPAATLPPGDSVAATELVLCAKEYETCTFSGTREVRYGTSTQYVTRTLTGGFVCNNSVFPDPASGIDKFCWYADGASTASSSTPITAATTTPITAATTTPATVATTTPATVAATTPLPVVVPPAAGGQYLFFGDAELATVRSRIANGPFKSDSDAWSGSPGDWDRIIRFADAAVSQGLEDKNDEHVFWYAGQRMVAAAFAWLVTGKTNTAYFNAARSQLLTICTDPAYDIRNGSPNSDNMGHAKMMPRVALAYDILKSNLSAADIATINSNLVGWGNFLKGLHDGRHASVMSQAARSVDWVVTDGNSSSDYAYKDAAGVLQARLPVIALWINNRTSFMYFSMGLIGVVTDNQTLIDAGKLYFDDWVKYGMHSSGVQGDYNRGGDYGVPQQGRTYSSVNIQGATLLAEALRRKKGDNSLYTFTTSAGAFGWEGGSKSLRLAIETHLDLLARAKNFYSAWGGAGGPSAASHLGLASIPNSGYSYHDLGFMVARQALPGISQKVHDVVRRNRSVYPSLETFPTSTPDTGSGYDRGFGWTDVLQALPAIWILYGQP